MIDMPTECGVCAEVVVMFVIEELNITVLGIRMVLEDGVKHEGNQRVVDRDAEPRVAIHVELWRKVDFEVRYTELWVVSRAPADVGKYTVSAIDEMSGLLLITLNGPLYKGEDVQVSARIRAAMLLGLLAFILTMYV